MSTSSAASSLISLSPNRHRLHVRLRRESSTADWAVLEQTGRSVMEQISQCRHRCVLLDLSEIDYLGSSSIAFLMRIWKHINQLEGRMVVVISDPKVYEIIRLSGLVKIWTIFDNVKAAEQQLSEERKLGRNIGPMLFLSGLLALAVAGGLSALPLFTEDRPSQAQLISQLSLAGLAVGLLLWATRIFTSRFRWATLATAAVACGLCVHAAYAIFNPTSVSAETPAANAAASSETPPDDDAASAKDSPPSVATGTAIREPAPAGDADATETASDTGKSPPVTAPKPASEE